MHISKTLIKKNHAVSNYQKAINILLKAKFAFGLKQHVQIRYHMELPIQSRQYRQNYRCVCSGFFFKMLYYAVCAQNFKAFLHACLNILHHKNVLTQPIKVQLPQ